MNQFSKKLNSILILTIKHEFISHLRYAFYIQAKWITALSAYLRTSKQEASNQISDGSLLLTKMSLLVRKVISVNLMILMEMEMKLTEHTMISMLFIILKMIIMMIRMVLMIFLDDKRTYINFYSLIFD